ncbi:MAG: hypothetical protein LBD85_05365 [Oscillospiraceae bacterium]|nr:hypothetical protein [Oscillospiraceae bacterium]
MRFDTKNTAGLELKVKTYLADFASDLVCPVQIWYEALGGYGAPTKDDKAAIAAALGKQPEWTSVGDTRYEKYGAQPTWTRASGQIQPARATPDKFAVQHLFKVNGVYVTPENRKYKVVLSEVYNLRCFELDASGNMIGPMVKIDPRGDIAKTLKPA